MCQSIVHTLWTPLWTLSTPHRSLGTIWNNLLPLSHYAGHHLSCIILDRACVCTQSLSRVRLFATPWTVAHQAPLSMDFPRQEYWSGLPSPSPGDLLNPGIEPGSPALVGRFLTLNHQGSPVILDPEFSTSSVSALCSPGDIWLLLETL